MRRFTNLLVRFRQDERGAFAVIFGILTIVLIASAGAVVDFTSMQQSRTRAQAALDAAALALQARINIDSNTTLVDKSLAIVNEGINDSGVTVVIDTVTTNTTEGSIEIKAHATAPTFFVALMGIPNIEFKVTSQATRKQLDLEVAMVLDNSGSMANSSRMTNLKKAARCAVNILYNKIANCLDATLNASDSLTPTVANVKIGIAPFNEFVNVGTGYKTATWMNQTGNGAVSRSGFDSDDAEATLYTGNVNRFNLYTTMGITWKGCVMARNHTTGAGGLYYDTSDLAPLSGTPDSMFDPLFAQDQSDGFANSWISDRPSACTNRDQGAWTQVTTKTNCTKNANGSSSNWSSATCDATVTTVRTQKDQNGTAVSPAAVTEPASINGQPKVCGDAYAGTQTTTNPAPKRYTNTWTRTCSYTFSNRETHERLCKYVAANALLGTFSSGPGGMTGPNADCGVSMQVLTATKSSLISKISAMTSSGGTNIHQGVMWGYHMLSPTEPLTEAKAFGGTTTKVMIVMTDGENTHSATSDYAGADWSVAYGYPYEGANDNTLPRKNAGLTGTTDAILQTEMDNRTKTTCANAKAAGIDVYTIGLSPPNQTTIDMLTACASSASKAYFPTNSADLVTVFQTIANQLADLRLAK